MGDAVLIDELHVTVHVPADLSQAAVKAVHRALAGDAFADRLRAGIAAVVREFPALAPTVVAVSR